MQDLLIKFKAEDTVAYHDMNDDMKVSRQESVEKKTLDQTLDLGPEPLAPIVPLE